MPTPTHSQHIIAQGDDLDLRLDDATVSALLVQLPELAAGTVRAITEEVPAYRSAFAGPLGASITRRSRSRSAGSSGWPPSRPRI